MGIKVIGTGMYVPDLVITNDDMAGIVETSDEWITKRTGIKQRRLVNGELNYQMGAKAAAMAIKEAGLAAEEIDMIIGTTISPDCYTPSFACLVGCELGNSHAPAFDLNAACTGFVYAMDMAHNFLSTGAYKTVLIVSSEIMSRVIDFKDRGTCVLFGDGAGACVVTASNGIYSSYLGGKPSGARSLYAKIPYEKHPFQTKEASFEDESIDRFEDSAIFMQGEEIFKFAATMLPAAVTEAAKRANITVQDIDMLIPHQANVRILQLANKKLEIPENHFYLGIEDYGNISSACIPLGIHTLKQKGALKDRDKICIAGFGAGLTYGAVVFEW